jgi:LmbE family N-acetylglucosaminyl deacetylase/glycosyltransferase involved in cell wall biosynthesis
METEDKLIPYHATDLTGKRVLALAPHPDDETIGCGGSLALHARAGDPVRVVFLTNGARGDTTGRMTKDAYVLLRQQEGAEACARLGIRDVEFWPYEDRSLAGARGALRRIMDLIDDFRPELVYAPSPLEFHPDHRAACILLCDAIGTCEGDFQVAFYEVGQPLRVNVLVDITPVLGEKEEAVKAYRSQLGERRYDDFTGALNRYRAMTLPANVVCAEGFSLWDTDIIRKIGPFSIPFQQVERLLPEAGESGPLVSVIVRTKDRPALLAHALKSIAGQTYANIEVVVVNDGGADVKDIVDAVGGGGIPVAYIAHEKNEGRSAAANTGLKAARGVYLNLLDDDDVFYSDHVETLVRAILLKGEKVAYSGVSNAYYEGPPQDPGNCVRKETIFNQPFDPDLFLFASHIPIMSVLFHRDVFQTVEGFSPDLDLFEDWDFLIRVSRRFRLHHVDKVTAEYRFYGVTDTEASHRGKYAYDQAQAALFDRAAPYLTGEGWIKFLKSELPYALGRNKSVFEKRMEPLTAALKEKAEALAALQTAYRHLAENLAQTSGSLDQAVTTINDLQSRNDHLSSALNEIVSSRGWVWLSRFRKVKSKLKFGVSR